MAVRISRAKQQIQKSGARFEFTVNDDFSGRPSTVMRILYLIFNEGYTVTTGSKLTRTDLTGEAIRLTRLLHALVPDDPEPAGLLALMLLIDSCRATRTSENGDLIPLADQDRTRWDHNYPRRIGTDPHRMVTRERGNVPPTGRHRRRSCIRSYRRGDRLETDRCALPGARTSRAQRARHARTSRRRCPRLRPCSRQRPA